MNSRPGHFLIVHGVWKGVLSDDHFFVFLDTLWDPHFGTSKTTKNGVFIGLFGQKPMRFLGTSGPIWSKSAEMVKNPEIHENGSKRSKKWVEKGSVFDSF